MRVCIAPFLAVLLLGVHSSPGALPELRGVWVHGPQIKTPAEANAVVARIERAHLNAAFVLVWYWGGQTYFRSTLCPMADGVPANYDPLGYMVEQCHKRGIQVHAWFVNGAYGARKFATCSTSTRSGPCRTASAASGMTSASRRSAALRAI